MAVSSNTVDLDVKAKPSSVWRASFVGDMEVQSGGLQVLDVKDFHTSALTSRDEGAKENLLISQLQWRPHADFTDWNRYIHPVEPQPKECHLLEKLTLLRMLDHLE
jgi:hypothetical protein